MKKANKAILFTALILPGTGHYILKRYTSAVILIGTSCVLLYLLISIAIERALAISDKILKEGIQPDLVEISRLASEASSGDEGSFVAYVTTAIIVVWVLALLDIFRVTRRSR